MKFTIQSSRERYYVYLLFFINVFLFISCVKNNPAPSWIEVKEWELVPNIENSYEGNLTHDFTDAWVFADDKFVGVFEVPFKIPILKSGKTKITLYPTILNNGISGTKKIYPFVEPYIIYLELVQNESVVVKPVTKYYNNVVFTIIDFEDASNHLVDSPYTLASLAFSNDPNIIEERNGTAFGKVELSHQLNSWVAVTDFGANLPRGGAEVYLEVDHMTSVDLYTGVLGISPSEVVDNVNVRINKQENNIIEWKKIYIELTTIVSGSPNAHYFEHSFKADLEDDQTNGVVNIDNIKIIHFQ